MKHLNQRSDRSKQLVPPLCMACANGYHDELSPVAEHCACPCHQAAQRSVAAEVGS